MAKLVCVFLLALVCTCCLTADAVEGRLSAVVAFAPDQEGPVADWLEDPGLAFVEAWAYVPPDLADAVLFGIDHEFIEGKPDPIHVPGGDWMALVGQVAAAHYDGELLKGPLRLFLQFVRVRPMGHFGTGRNAGTVKDSAPRYPTTIPDTVKLARAVEDALTKVIWHDDSQVVVHELHKSYGKQACVKVVIETLDGKYH